MSLQILKVIGGDLVTKLCLTLVTPWTIAHQASLSIGFPRQKYWSGLPCPPPGDLPDPVIKPGASHMSPELAGRFFTTVPAGKPEYTRSQMNQIRPSD